MEYSKDKLLVERDLEWDVRDLLEAPGVQERVYMAGVRLVSSDRWADSVVVPLCMYSR